VAGADEEKRFKVVALDEIESVSGPATLTWKPVRLTLGVRAFGTNAYSAEEAGHDVVEPHTEETEDPSQGHQELYFVFRGTARFTIDGETFDAPAGTYVFLPDPKSHRHAVAVEPGTTVLSFGGPPVFEPSAWEWYFRAAGTCEQPERAREILEEGLRLYPESSGMYYELACLEARLGRSDEALAALREAVKRRPEAAAWARTDADLAPLRDDPRFGDALRSA
jgi:tetratricopeptide (TPR) repeat protein